MTDGVDHFGPTDPDALDQAERLVLHVDADGETRAEIAAAITDHDADVDVVAVPSVERARAVLSVLRVDCLVVGETGSTEFLSETDVPVVLYTQRDPGGLDEATLAAVDTVVERRDTGVPVFLVRKVLSLLDADRGRTQYALARALSRAGVDDDHETHQFLVDDDGTVVWASAPFESVFPVGELDTPLPDTDDFDERLQALLADAPTALSTVFRTRDGADRAGRESITVRTGVGESYFVHSGYRLPPALSSLRLEVFEHVSTEVRREARIELLEVLVEESKDGLYTLDEHGNIEFYNSTFAEMLGYDDDELVGQHASTVLVDGELEHGQEQVARLLEAESDSARVDLAFRTRSGETIEMSVHFTLLPTDGDTYAGLMGVARDISERKQRERELQEYRKLVEAARDPMFVLDAEGDITLFNEAMERVVDAETLAGRPLTSLFSGQDRRQMDRLLSGLRAGESEWGQYELRLTDRDGVDRLYEATVGALREDGEFDGTVGTLRDITERNRRTHELDLLKQVLARVLRHNIRSQLTVVQSYAEQLAADDVDRSVAAEAILESVDSLLATSEKAREIERLVDSDVDRRRMELRSVVDGALDGVAADHPEADCDVDVPSVAVHAHPALATAVENAVENAVVHTEDAQIAVTASVSDDRVELRVSDDGPGIPETDLAAIEQREETQLQHTSGAGLWLIDWVVDRSGGDLTLDSDDDGTTLCMTFDRAGVDNIS